MLHVFRGIYRDRAEDAKFTFLKIHVYGFSKARDPEFHFHECIRIALAEVAEVHLVVPGKWMLCALFVLPESVPLQEDHPILADKQIGHDGDQVSINVDDILDKVPDELYLPTIPKVPENLRRVNVKAYEPEMIAIGPFT
ncbi:hypothetical protein CUMW_275940 [Citrus unshiu]|uniref:Uncharacterized protein n=1 Tax=Citrus unshiu TaxID=55188 RepID=A0A2H5N172_CITUN|nr:hypothetical protein CUMW_275940 [Citrus unshiu]